MFFAALWYGLAVGVSFILSNIGWNLTGQLWENHLPDDFQANYYLGLIYREMGHFDLALEYFEDSDEDGLGSGEGRMGTAID